MKNIALIIAVLPLVLNACSPVGMATGAGATAGTAAAQEGGIEGALIDTRIRATINDLWFKYDLETFAKLNLTVDQGRVLITGVVQNPEHRVEAVRLAWQAEGVREVINEIRVARSGGVAGYARDTWITTRLRTALTLDRQVMSINYSIDTVQGIVYLMGVARYQQELNHVIEIARTIPDVKQVVSYVKLIGEKSTPAKGYVQDSGGGQPQMPADNMQPAPLVPEPVQSQPLPGNTY
ncbi:MAG: BON domain-containing protein [Alphaproteobacteria bacterium]|nr:BON domain-containing protein [Alphaproteobacteria bacterium]